jgi:hypothetical protein
MSTLKADTIQNTSGGAVTLTKQSAAKAWGSHDNLASPTLNETFNVTSLTDNATGQTAFNLTSAMSTVVNVTGYSVQHTRTTVAVEASAVRGTGNTSSTIQTITNVGGSDVDRQRSMTIHGDLA